MDALHSGTLAVLIFIAAVLYSSVGHAGASGYLAAMALLGVAPAVMRPTALALNVAVALIASVKFIRVGYFSWALFWPFAVASVPAAYLGGRLGLPSNIYKAILGVVLLFAAWRLFRTARQGDADTIRPPHLAAALFSGGVIGVLSGLTGVGGGIFLSPLMLLMQWARTRESSGVAALFILVNSVSALLGDPASLGRVTGEIALWMPAAVVGGWIGAEYGSKRLATPLLRQCLAAVLVVAGFKLIAT